MARPIRGRADYLELGDWNAVCFECGRKRKASYMKKHWQGYWVCPEHWEARQPQDFVRAVPDIIQPPWVQPPEDTFVQVCTWEGRMGIVDVGTVDCMVVDFIAPAWDAGEAFVPGTANELDFTFYLDQSNLS